MTTCFIHWFINFSIESLLLRMHGQRFAVSGAKSGIIPNQQLPQELHKPITEWTHPGPFSVDLRSKFHVESSFKISSILKKESTLKE